MRNALSVALCLLVAVPVDAQVRASSADQASTDQDDYPLLQQQERPEPQQPQATRGIQNSGRVADSAVGIVGQRQTREQMGSYASPMGRIASRIPNRVQNRIRNRIDPSYDPQANAASPFLTAEDQARLASRGR